MQREQPFTNYYHNDITNILCLSQRLRQELFYVTK